MNYNFFKDDIKVRFNIWNCGCMNLLRKFMKRSKQILISQYILLLNNSKTCTLYAKLRLRLLTVEGRGNTKYGRNKTKKTKDVQLCGQKKPKP